MPDLLSIDDDTNADDSADRRPVTIKELKQMRHLYHTERLSTLDVGERLDRNPSVVSYHIDTRSRSEAAKNDDPAQKQEAQRIYDQGLTTREVAEKMDVSQKWVLRVVDTRDRSEAIQRGQRKRYWPSTWEKAKRAAHLRFDQDMRAVEGAEEMGVSVSAFYRYLKIYRNPSDYAPQ